MANSPLAGAAKFMSTDAHGSSGNGGNAHCESQGSVRKISSIRGAPVSGWPSLRRSIAREQIEVAALEGSRQSIGPLLVGVS
jgi:hypothetical protein